MTPLSARLWRAERGLGMAVSPATVSSMSLSTKKRNVARDSDRTVDVPIDKKRNVDGDIDPTVGCYFLIKTSGLPSIDE